jgi:sulfur-oxidizing protein SoxX
MNHFNPLIAAMVVAVALLGCAQPLHMTDLDVLTEQVIRSSFHDQGAVKVQRITQTDETNRACSQADVLGRPLDEKTRQRIQEMNMTSILWPADGQFLGDWKKGEEIAQSGRGLTWSDDPQMPNGGNCYNCHQITLEEIAYGNIGPSLYQYGKLRGVQNPYNPTAQAIVQYTWGKIWNAKAYDACSSMPRAGHMGILTSEQVSHLVALLLDPRSPVNR